VTGNPFGRSNGHSGNVKRFKSPRCGLTFSSMWSVTPAVLGRGRFEKRSTDSAWGTIVKRSDRRGRFERNLIRERTVAGLKAARARGRTGGRPSKLSAKEIKTIHTLFKSARSRYPKSWCASTSHDQPSIAPSSSLQLDLKTHVKRSRRPQRTQISLS
jgi:hypothetical protein